MDMRKLREDFPTLRRSDDVYLDSACQSLRPDSVIKAITDYYTEYPSCGDRSVHSMGSRVSLMEDNTRESLSKLFGTDNPDCYVFTKNTTEALNTVAFGLGLESGDTVVTTDSEHNSNHVPWLVLSKEKGIRRRYVRTDADGEFDMESFKDCLDGTVKAVSVHHSSNVTGCTMPVREICEMAHDIGAKVVIDGAQAAPHMKVDLEKIDPDFYCFSMHKMLGPSGMGIMYGKYEELEKLRPLTFGGGTVGRVTYENVTFASPPAKFESGLQNYSGIAGTGAAVEYLRKVGMENVEEQDRKLMRAIVSETKDIEGLEIVGPEDPDRRGSVFSFNIKGLTPHDIALTLDYMHVMIRSGMHCAHPYFEGKHTAGSARASVYLYNDKEDVKRFAEALRTVADNYSV
ncbi:MAG: aminotransferase class V-fold PLP-dependent enzyme [Candidatus Methanomethylophilaceae archaeon]|jgi:cysteine desulfurase/selenocysteine lyase